MNDFKTLNLTGKKFIDQKGVVFSMEGPRNGSKLGYGVINASGKVLCMASKSGKVLPTGFNHASTAKIVADTMVCDGSEVWLEVVK